MEYSMEDLLPVVGMLADKYTGRDSSSITYDKARQLMGAVIYCINELRMKKEWQLTGQSKTLKPEDAYKIGYEMVLEKVLEAKRQYEIIILDSQDYNCRNIHDTVIKGIPQFFINYDPRFRPQDTILTLDYPAIKPLGKKTGVDAIHQYLENLGMEWMFLNLFDNRRMEALMNARMPGYQDLYLGNICEEVLLQALGCVMARRQIPELTLNSIDISSIKDILRNRSLEDMEVKIKGMLKGLINRMFPENQKMEAYFLYAAHDMAVRLNNGIQNSCLEQIWKTEL